jgi:hypothetical protein
MRVSHGDQVDAQGVGRRKALDQEGTREGRAPGTKDAADGPASSAAARPATGAKKAPRPRKGTVVDAETAEVLRDAEAGKNLLDYPSLEAMFEDLGI